MNQPSRKPPDGDPSDPTQSDLPQRGLPWGWLLLTLALLLWNGYVFLVPKAPPSLSLSYSEFLNQVNTGNVSAVTIAGQTVTGEFKSPVASTSIAGAPTAGTSAAGPATPGEPVSYSNFDTVVPQQPNQELLPVLEQHGVNVTVRDTTGSSFLTDLALTALPMLLLIGVFIFMGRQAQRGQQNIFRFSGSQARRYAEERPSVTFADVAGDEAKGELAEIVDFLREPSRYRALGARLPRGVLLVGPPGTGKTLLARAVAGEARVPFFSINASEFVEMFVGVGASRVRDLFAKAKSASPSIMFVDELDAVGRQRGAGLGGGNDEREQTLNQLLAEMDGFDKSATVIVLAATNRPDVLDPALLRPGRFDRQITVGLPDREGRKAVLKIHTHQLVLGEDVDIDVLARRTPGFSGADLSNLCNEAALHAARRHGKSVTMDDFENAMERIVFGTRQAIVMSEAERRLVAYHEGGHALVAKLTPGTDPVNKVSIIPHGQALGVTEQLPAEDRHNYPRQYLLDRLSVMLAGRAAEEMVFAEPTTGAESDLKQATSLARRMVGSWGMSEELGPVHYGVGETHPFLGRELAQPREYAEATAATLDMSVRKLLEEARQSARRVLENQRHVLDALVDELLAHETIDGARIDVLLKELAGTTSVQPNGEQSAPVSVPPETLGPAPAGVAAASPTSEPVA